MNEITDRMKKYLFFLSAVSIALFTACSSEEDVAETPTKTMTQEEYNAILAEANMDSEVQIRLGMGSPSNSVTRAPLESDANGLFETPENQYLGIYCLAQSPQVTPSTAGPKEASAINWTTDGDLSHLMLLNQAAKVVKVTGGEDVKIGNVPLASGTVSEVQFVDGNSTKIYYYPYGNWYNYYFYGYYPRQTTNLSETSNRIAVTYTINGTQDIIWGKAAPSGADATKGYNAKYMRDKQKTHGDGLNTIEELPALAMDHKLTQLRFWVKTSSGTYATSGYGEANGKKTFQITDLKLTKVPTSWTLVVADRNNTANDEGTLTNGATPADLKVKFMDVYAQGHASEYEANPATASDADKFNGSTSVDIPYIASTDNTTKPRLLGYLMIPTTEMMETVTIPDRTDKTVPYMDFTISYGGIVGGSSSSAQTWNFTDQKIELPTDGFENGKVYNVILNIPTPEEIAMLATLEDWDWVSVTAGGAQNIDVEVE